MVYIHTHTLSIYICIIYWACANVCMYMNIIHYMCVCVSMYVCMYTCIFYLFLLCSLYFSHTLGPSHFLIFCVNLYVGLTASSSRFSPLIRCDFSGNHLMTTLPEFSSPSHSSHLNCIIHCLYIFANIVYTYMFDEI